MEMPTPDAGIAAVLRACVVCEKPSPIPNLGSNAFYNLTNVDALERDGIGEHLGDPVRNSRAASSDSKMPMLRPLPSQS